MSYILWVMNLCLVQRNIVGIKSEWICEGHLQHLTEQYTKYLLLLIHYEFILLYSKINLSWGGCEYFF